MSIRLDDLVRVRVDDLEPAIALGRVELRLVRGGVDEPDAGVVDPASVGRVVVLVGRVARGEPAHLSARAACRGCGRRSPSTRRPRRACRPARSPCGRSAGRPPRSARRSGAVFRLIATTSARLGLETIKSRPSLVEYMSSTNWSLPSPTAAGSPGSRPGGPGSCRSRAAARWMSGMMLIRATRLKFLCGSITSAVPSQLLPTKTTSRTPVGRGRRATPKAPPARTRPRRSPLPSRRAGCTRSSS